MSENDSSSKTEPPTPKKIRDARKKGQVAKSKEVVSLVLLVAMTLCFWLLGDKLLAQFKALFQIPTRYAHLPFEQIIWPVLYDALIVSAGAILVFPLLTVFLFSIIANIMQTGWVVSSESVKPKLQNISFINGFKKIFSPQNAMEFFKSNIKIIVLCCVAWHVLKKDMMLLMEIPQCGSECALFITGAMMMNLIIYCLAAFVFLAGADYALERFLYFKKLRMSLDEVRREYKETEGNPEIKGKRKEIHRELMNEEVLKKRVKQSDVLITNPIHFAVGIRYDTNLSPLPFVTIKGEHLLANKLKKMAYKQNIPIIENVPLARALFAKIDVDQKITSEFVEPIADIIKWLRHQSEQTY